MNYGSNFSNIENLLFNFGLFAKIALSLTNIDQLPVDMEFKGG
jgi:hypothetical protein